MWDEIKKFAADVLEDLKELLIDFFMVIFEGLLDGIATLIEAIPLPDFIGSFSIVDYLPQDILFFLYVSGFGPALGVIGAAYTFYFTRRILTLGIW